ncbi:MAG: peptidoglycan editing factor PgeF [Pseudomonadota bacterium]
MITSSSALDRAGVVHGFGTRHGGTSTGVFASANMGGHGDDALAVEENRRRFAQALGADANALCTLRQVHGPKVVRAERGEVREREGDALISATAGLVLGVTTADCVPVLLADAAAGVAGAVHAGWRGTLAGVVANAVDALAAAGGRPERTIAAIGPCIRQTSYEVDALVRDAAHAALGKTAERWFRVGRDDDHWWFDLAGVVDRQLRERRIKTVDDSRLDTLNNETIYFSHRRNSLRGEARYGVHLSAVVVPKPGT